MRKNLWRKLIAVFLCVTAVCCMIPIFSHVFADDSQTAKEATWISTANGILAKRVTDAADPIWAGELKDHFYENVDFDTTGNLTWATGTLLTGAVQWNGTMAGTTNTGTTLQGKMDAAALNPDMIPAIDETSNGLTGYDFVRKTYYVYSPQQLWYAFDALKKSGTNNTNCVIEIMRDLDFNGENFYWPNDLELANFTTVIGHESKKMLNLCVLYDGTSGDVASALISSCEALRARDLTFYNAYVCSKSGGKSKTAVFLGNAETDSDNTADFLQLVNMSFRDCVVIGAGLVVDDKTSAACMVGRLIRTNANAPDTANTQNYIENCSVINSLVAGGSHTGSLTSTLNTADHVTNCFSIESTVISFGVHSGGLFSCVYFVNNISNCFVDAKVYGSKATGVFTGEIADCHIYSCFSSGFIEGKSQLGGFAGQTGAGRNATVIDCYTTALVGMKNGGVDLGGFIGMINNASGYNTAFINCYAAGEVGAADTLTGPPATGVYVHKNELGNNDYIGGFCGRIAATNLGRIGIAYCYYDKQTTAMREWDVGNYFQQLTLWGKLENPNYSVSYLIPNGAGNAKMNIGVRGVLTTTTDKSGTGLTDIPNSETPSASSPAGFAGFRDMSSFYGTVVKLNSASYQNEVPTRVVPYNGWDYATANHYPELKAFSEATSANFGEFAELVRDYSKSSTSTVLLETWEKRLDTETGLLVKDEDNPTPETTYDTVRDLTIKFTMTGIRDTAPQTEKEPFWARIETSGGTVGQDTNGNPDPNKNGANVTIVGGTFDVLQLAKETTVNGDTHFYASQFAPGLEWLVVRYGGAERRLRVMPTVGIEAGVGKTIYCPPEDAPWDIMEPAYYDHANDVEMYFSTAARLAVTMADITTGTFPDLAGTGGYDSENGVRFPDDFTERQQWLMKDGSTLTDAEIADVNAYYEEDVGVNGDNDKFTAVKVGYMARPRNTLVTAAQDLSYSSYDSLLYVYGRKIEGIDSITGEIITSETDRLNFASEGVRQVYNGYKLSEHEDGMVMLEYMWQLNDGRVVNDAKVIVIKATPFESVITAYDAGGLSIPDLTLTDDNDMLVNMQLVPLAQKPDPVVETGNDTFHLTADHLYNSYKDENDITRPTDAVGPEYGEGLVASWKVTNPMRTVTKLTLKMDSGRKDKDGNKVFFTASVINPKENDTIRIEYEYYQVIAQVDGKFFVNIESKEREYTIHKTGDTFYLVFNYNNEDTQLQSSVVNEYDVANHIYVDLELSAILTVDKFVTGDYADASQAFEFSVTLDDKLTGDPLSYEYFVREIGAGMPDAGDGYDTVTADTAKTFSLKGKQEFVIIGLPYGTEYTVTESDYSSIQYLTTADGIAGRELSDKVLDVDTAKEKDKADRTHVFYNDKSFAPPTGLSFDIQWVYLLLLPASAALCVILIARHKRKKYRG